MGKCDEDKKRKYNREMYHKSGAKEKRQINQLYGCSPPMGWIQCMVCGDESPFWQASDANRKTCSKITKDPEEAKKCQNVVRKMAGRKTWVFTKAVIKGRPPKGYRLDYCQPRDKTGRRQTCTRYHETCGECYTGECYQSPKTRTHEGESRFAGVMRW